MALITKPNLKQVTLMEVLAEHYPNVKAHADGDGTDYEYLHVEAGSDPIPPLAELQAKQDYMTRVNVWSAIKAERDARQANGVKVGANWFHSDPSSRIQQLALVIFAANLPGNIMWKCLDGAFVLMTPTLAVQIFQASAASDIAIFTVAETHKAQMNASSNPVNYDFSTGWPPTYEGSLLL
jgi:hypothetical protein